MGKTKIECKKLDVLTGTQKCVFCSRTDINEMKYGPIYMHRNIITHYYCLLLSSNMEQNGRDCDGILGFLPNDIHKEVKRGVRLYCSFCRNGGATLGCAIAKCKVVFHLPCGMKHGTLHQFFGEFKSFCAKHRPVQRISGKILAESSRNAMCGICYEKVVPRPIHETLWAPCCQKSAFFHRDCVQRLATSAGYFFKCPLCNNVDKFQKEMKEFGIYIPEQDASWECVPNAYEDLLVRHDACDSASCICPSGRKTNNQGTRWELILCKFCGSQGMHIGCGRLKWKSPEFVCDICTGNNETGSEEANSRNYEGNRHRLSGSGRTAEIHPSVSADREGERSDDESSNESTKVTLTNRGGRRRVISPPPKVATPTPPPIITSKTHKKSERDVKNPVSANTIVLDDPVNENLTVVIDDSDDDVEVVSETKGSGCLKTNDGATIPVIQMKNSVKKRLNVEGDVKVVPEEIVDITIQMQGPPKKKAPTPHVEEVIYDYPSLSSKPSTSISYNSPSTSFATPPDVTKFVLVDPSTFRPEDLPPGTVLYRSVAPMMTVPQTTMPSQPNVQQIPSSQVPMSQLGGASRCCADAKHPDLSKHRRRRSINLHTPACHTKETSRSNKHNSFGRRGRRRNHDRRLKPLVLVSPLKCRISNDGFLEILLPRRNLGFGFGFGSLKRKASPLPSCPAKKIKISSKDSFIKGKKNNLKKDIPNKKKNANKGKNGSFKIQKGRNKKGGSQENKIVHHDKKEKSNSNCSSPINVVFSSNKSNLKKKKNSSHESKESRSKSKESRSMSKVSKLGKGKENSFPGEKTVLKKKQWKKKKDYLMEWKYKKIDEYLSKYNSNVMVQSDSFKEKNNTLNLKNESSITVQLLLDDLIEFVVKDYVFDEQPSTSSETSEVPSTDVSIETNSNMEHNPLIMETECKNINITSDMSNVTSPDICNETAKNNTSIVATSANISETYQLFGENSVHVIKCNHPVFSGLNDSSDMKKITEETKTLDLKTKTESHLLSSPEENIHKVSDVSCGTNKEKDISPAKHNHEVREILDDWLTPSKLSFSSHDLVLNDISRQTKDDSSKEACFNTGEHLSSPVFEKEDIVSTKKYNNGLKISRNPCGSTRKTHSLFPKIRIKTSKMKSNVNKKTKVFKRAEEVAESKITDVSELRNKIKSAITKNKNLKKDSLGDLKESSRKVIDKSKTKRNVIDLKYPKSKRNKMEKVCNVGTIEKYFSPITSDKTCSPIKTIVNMTSKNDENVRKIEDGLPPPLTDLESNRFWRTLNSLDRPDEERNTTSPSPATKLHYPILWRTLNTQYSPEKRPLMELQLNNTVSTNAAKAIQFENC